MLNQSTTDIERRCYPFHVRAGAPADSPVLEGYAAVFNSETVLIARDAMWKGSPEIRETIEPGAFTKTLKEGDQRAFWNHNSDIILGRTGNSTMRLWEDKRGLGTEITPPQTDLVRDMVMEPIKRGDVDQMSFGFSIVREDRAENEDGSITYTLREVKLYEVSPVALPAYSDTEISARSKERIDQVMEQRRLAAPESTPGNAHLDASTTETTPSTGHLEESTPSARHLDEAFSMRLAMLKAA